MKTTLVLGGGGFIGSHLAKKLKENGNFVRIVDIKPKLEYFQADDICHEYIQEDLRDPAAVSRVMFAPDQYLMTEGGFDEVYQLAADMGGAGYIFTGENDANIMHNSALINLNVIQVAVETGVEKLFYSSSACIYPAENQQDSSNPNCEESSAYPANPDSEYGWEKLFSERLYLAAKRNFGLDVRIARFHNIFGPQSCWNNGKEKAPAAICRKVAESTDEIEIWGTGEQTRSFLYIDECIEGVLRLMDSDFTGPVNIGSEEMISINDLAQMVIEISGKSLRINNIHGEAFDAKYGFKCPVGVMGRNSDNRLIREKLGWAPKEPLEEGMRKLYQWISNQVVTNK